MAKKQVDATNKNYEELFDFTPACYYTLSREGDILNLNNSGALMLGKAPNSLIKSRFGLFVSDATKPIFNQFLQNIYNTKTKLTTEVTLLLDNNFPVHVYLVGLITDNGKECHINLVDISERKKKEEELKKMFDDLTIANIEIVAKKDEIEKGAKDLVITHKELEQSLNLNADKNLFISNLAHDLKSPFSVLLGLTEVLMESIYQIDLAEIETIAKEINQSAKNTFELLENMLKWARMQSGKLPFEPKKLKFVEISNEVIKILQPYAISKNLTLINSL